MDETARGSVAFPPLPVRTTCLFFYEVSKKSLPHQALEYHGQVRPSRPLREHCVDGVGLDARGRNIMRYCPLEMRIRLDFLR
jgi:hypothetical protein